MLKRIDLSLIDANPDQPRKDFNVRDLQDLAASIASNGLMQPITVRPSVEAKGRFEIVAGERRWRAHCMLAEQGRLPEGTILAHVRRMDDDQRDIEAIVENMARKDITPIEEARAFQRMICKGWTIEDLAKQLGRHAFRIEERVRLLNLDPQILKLYEGGQLSQEAASEISRVKDHRTQTRLVQLVSSGRLVGFKAIRTAVQTALGEIEQVDIFGDSAPKVSEEDLQTLSRMEAKVDAVVALASAGWKDGECVIATKVSPDRAKLMAEKLAHLQKAIRAMENQLRAAAAQVDFVLKAAE